MEIFYIFIFLCLLTLVIPEKHKPNDNRSTFHISVPRYSHNIFEEDSIDWCSLPCGRQHIVCLKRGDCDVRSPCKIVRLKHAEIIVPHNELRSYFATGKENLTGGIKVANMMALTWDDNLALTARCSFQYDCQINLGCQTTPQFPHNIGQNTFASQDNGNFNCAKNIKRALQIWYGEINDTSLEEITEIAQSYRFGSLTSKFYQLVSALTTHVGCAMTKQFEENFNFTICQLVCNYGPGLKPESRVWLDGVPCSKCPTKHCGADGLCRNEARLSLFPNIRLVVILVFCAYNFSSFIK